MAAVADNKRIRLDHIDVQIECDTREGYRTDTAFHVRIQLSPGLTGREKTILYNVARRCEVSKMLSGKLSFEYELNEKQ